MDFARQVAEALADQQLSFDFHERASRQTQEVLEFFFVKIAPGPLRCCWEERRLLYAAGRLVRSVLL